MSRRDADQGKPKKPQLMICPSRSRLCRGCLKLKPHPDRGNCGSDHDLSCPACVPAPTKPRKARKWLPTTPRSQVRRAVAMIFTRSRERSAAIKRTGNCCADCGAKFRPKDTRNGPKLKCEVHHLDGGHLDEIVDEIFRWLLCSPDRLRPVCVPCHERADGRSASRA